MHHGQPSKRMRTANASGDTYVVDLTHFLDENGLPPVGAPRRLLKMLSFFGSIVEAASCHPVGTRFPSVVPCRRRPCSRRGLTVANGQDGTIRWKCPGCGENGCISKWQGSDYDLSAAVETDASRHLGIYITAEEHKLLSEIITNSQEEHAIVAGAVVTPKGIWISGRAENFDLLLGSMASDANHTRSAERRKLLYAIYDRVEKLVADTSPE